MAENQVACTECITAEHPAGDTLGSPEAVRRAVEHALDMPEADKMLFPLLVVPAQGRPGSDELSCL